MSKRIEKEPDGYIRDLLRKRRDPIIVIVGFNAFITGVFLILALILIIATLKPLPTETYSGSFVLKEIDTDRHGGRLGGNNVEVFVAQSGERFAIPTGLMDIDELEIGNTYDITYYIGFLYQRIYTISDSNNVYISENDQIAYREKNISEMHIDLLVIGGIWLVLTLLLNFGLLSWSCYKKVFEINQKIEKRRAKRNKKNDRAQAFPTIGKD